MQKYLILVVLVTGMLLLFWMLLCEKYQSELPDDGERVEEAEKASDPQPETAPITETGNEN